LEWALEKMNAKSKADETRWQVMKAMLDDFPDLRVKVKKYLKTQNPKTK
jgi:hypothetical protein